MEKLKTFVNDSVRDAILQTRKEFDTSTLTGEEALKDELGLNSLDVMEVIMAVEHKSGLRIPNKKIKDIFFLKDLYRLFEEAA